MKELKIARKKWLETLISAKFYNLNFQPLEVVSHYRDPQLQVNANYSYLFNPKPNICKS